MEKKFELTNISIEKKTEENYTELKHSNRSKK